MFISKLTVCNLGPFGPAPVCASPDYAFEEGRHSFTFRQGSVGVFGPNGSGKSTLVDLAYAALTNDFSRFDGLRADCINHHAAKGEPAYVAVELSRDGAGVQLTRGLRHTRYSLKIQGEKRREPYAAREGDERLRQLGLDKRILDFCVFKRQPGSDNAIDDFLRSTPTERAASYMALNGTLHCQVVYDTLGDMLNKDPDLCTEVVDDSDELVAQIGTLESEQAALVVQQKGWKKLRLKKEVRRPLEDLVAQADRRPALAAVLKKIVKQLDDCECEDEEVTSRLKKRRKGLKKASTACEALQGEYQRARLLLEAWDAYEQYTQRSNKLREGLQAARDRLKDLKAPTRPEDADPIDLVRQRTELDAAYQAARKVLKTFERTGLSECPTCGTEVSSFEDRLYAQKELCVRAPAELADLQARIDALNAHDKEVRRHVADKAALVEKVKSFQHLLDELTPVAEPESSRAQCRRVDSEFQEAGAAVELWRGRVEQSEKLAAVLAERLSGLRARRAEVEAELSSAGPEGDEEVTSARAALKSHDKAVLELAQLKGRLEGLQAQLADKVAQLARLRERVGRSKKLRRAAQVLRRVRDACHTTALPQRVAQANLRRVVGEVNRGLASFGEPFWVEADDSLSFIVHKPGEPPHKAERLSGGQKVVLALAFWPALNSLFGGKPGMMVLDEPTANLDEQNVEFLRRVLARWTRQVRDRRQVVLISHADRLKGSFDQVFELKGQP